MFLTQSAWQQIIPHNFDLHMSTLLYVVRSVLDTAVKPAETSPNSHRSSTPPSFWLYSPSQSPVVQGLRRESHFWVCRTGLLLLVEVMGPMSNPLMWSSISRTSGPEARLCLKDGRAIMAKFFLKVDIARLRLIIPNAFSTFTLPLRSISCSDLVMPFYEDQ